MFTRVKRDSHWLFVLLLVLALAVPAVGALAAPAAAPAGQANSPQGEAAVAADPLTWQQVHQAPAGQYFYSLYFPTRTIGYAVSGPDWNNANNGAGAPTTISKTTDGGKTWKSTAIANTDGWMRGITCTDANNCWIAGRVNGKRILRTSNGGESWGTITNTSGYANWLWSAGWTGKGTTILAGTTCYDPDPNEGAVANWLRATDGITFKGVVARAGVMTCFVQWDIECPAAGTCYSAGKDYTWKSTDDGATWRGQLMEPRTRQYGLSCTSANSCWVVGKSPFIRSTTNGANWAANAVAGLGANGQFWDVAMADDKTGYAVGCDNVATDNTDRCLGKGMIYKTTDGLSWVPIAAPTTADIMDVWTLGASEVVIVDWSGKIWYGSTGPAPTPTPTNTATPTATATPSAGSILGFVFEDKNDDAFRDLDETGVPNAVMVLRRGGQEIATATTNADGAFRFGDVAPGQYTLRQKQAPEGYERSPFLVAFELTANREFTFYAAQPKRADLTPTPTPTVIVTATETTVPTSTATEAPSATPSATPESSATPTVRPTLFGWLPILLR